MRPLLRRQPAFGVGVDISPEVGRAGRELFARDEPGAHVAFVRAAAEQLPFKDASFDVVLCRVALPYMDNARVLGEIGRVLTPGGAFVLRFHNARFYTAEFREGIGSMRLKSAVHAMRVLLAGFVYHMSGIQPRGRLFGAETFQSSWLLARELGKHGMRIARVLPQSAPTAPSVLVHRLP
jgi:ubiquinone/menaquinone biosynthesis C-methylase UbiE